jgi:solute:Na+ symporter, SSS family
MGAGKVLTPVWSVLLVGGAILFIPLSEGTAAVEVALAVAGVVYGGLLGAFLLGTLSSRATGRSVNIGVAAGIGSVALIWIFFRALVAWPWFALIGALVTWSVGTALGRSDGRMGPDPEADRRAPETMRGTDRP